MVGYFTCGLPALGPGLRSAVASYLPNRGRCGSVREPLPFSRPGGESAGGARSNSLPVGSGLRVYPDAEADVVSAEASTAICVQRFDDSRNSAIHTTYRISLRSSSLREPRYPLFRVISIQSAGRACREGSGQRFVVGGKNSDVAEASERIFFSARVGRWSGGKPPSPVASTGSLEWFDRFQ